MLGPALLAATAHLLAAGRETLDRVVASVGNFAVTESDVNREYRFEIFLEGKAPAAAPDPATRERIRERLITQKLLAQEAEAESFDEADLSRRTAEALAEVRRKYASEQSYQSALSALGMNESQIRKRLADHERVLLLIDQRLRPAAWVEPSEIDSYYQTTFVPEFARRSSGPAPPLDQVETEIREILLQRKVDQLLESWIKELKASNRVRLHAF